MWVLVTAKGQRIAVRELPALVGSSRAADVVIPHESVAERHARLSAGDDGGLLVDALDGAALEVGGWQVAQAGLQAGDEIVIGRIGFTLEQASARPAPAARPAAAARPVARAGTAARRPGRGAESRPRADELQQRQRGPLVTRKKERTGWVHTDLSSLSGGSKLAVVTVLLALGAGLLWFVQWAVAGAL